MSRLDLELLKGACDIHLHSAPSLFHRHESVDIAEHARDMGLRAIVLKNHHIATMDRAKYVSEKVPGIDVFGSITLNYCVGGLNPFAVDVAIKSGAKVVWLPTIDSYQQKVHYGQLGGYGSYQSPEIPSFYSRVEGIKIHDSYGKILPEMKEIFQLVADANIILAVGHLTLEETELLIEEAVASGVKKVVVDHPHLPFINLSIEKQKEFVKAGAIMNYCFSEISPKWWSLPAKKFAAHIKELGPENITLSSDLGQLHNPLPAEGLRVFVQLLLEEGVEPDTIRKMLVENTNALLYDE